jgi:hypothetical protein
MQKEAHLSVEVIGSNAQPVKIELFDSAPLLEVMQDGAKALNIQLLPDAEAPLDLLHNFDRGAFGPALSNLEEPVGTYLDEKDTSKKFGIELVRAFRVNTRWAVAPTESMTPRQILALPAINLDYQSYTLYVPGKIEPLPLDVPVPISRGEVFEAQRDGKYGS